MGLFNWLGFGRPRDGPEMDGRASLPEVTDRVRAVSYTPLDVYTRQMS